MSVAQNPRQNHLLAALPAREFERLQAGLKLVPLPLEMCCTNRAASCVTSISRRRHRFAPVPDGGWRLR